MPQGSKWVEWSCIPISPEKLDLYHHPGILLTAFHLALKSVSVLTINYMILLYIRGVQGKLKISPCWFSVSSPIFDKHLSQDLIPYVCFLYLLFISPFSYFFNRNHIIIILFQMNGNLNIFGRVTH